MFTHNAISNNILFCFSNNGLQHFTHLLFPCRRYVSVGVIDEHIIAAGGYDGNQHLHTCEIYDPVSNIWTIKSPMRSQRSSAGGCVLNGYFFVSGNLLYFRIILQ